MLNITKDNNRLSLILCYDTLTQTNNEINKRETAIMTTELTTIAATSVTVAESIFEHASELIHSSESLATIKAKRADLKIFNEWLSAQDSQAINATAVILFITSQKIAGKSYATLQRYKSHVLQHFDVDFANNEKLALKRLMLSIAKNVGTKQKQAHALTVDEIKRLIMCCDKSAKGLRNRAMLSIGFSCALRVSEITALKVGDLKRLNESQGTLFIAKSKTDQAGAGYSIKFEQGENVQAIDAIEAHVKRAGLASDAQLFDITPLRFWQIIKELAAKAGIDGVSCHSLRSGFITCAAGAGKTLDKIKAVSRHKSTNILLGYIRDADGFNNNATKGVL